MSLQTGQSFVDTEQLRTMFTNLEQIKHMLRSQLDDVTRELSALQSQINGRINSRNLVARVPFEIWGEIICLCCASASYTRKAVNTRKNIVALLLTCKQWYEVAMRHPAIWTDIYTDYNRIQCRRGKQMIKKFHERSGSLELDVTFTIHGKLDLKGLLDVWSLLKYLVSQDKSRWRRFEFYWSSNFHDWDACIDFQPNFLNRVLREATRLEELVIENDTFSPKMYLTLSANMSRLTYLELNLVDCDWNFQPDVVLPCMKCLSIRYEDGDDEDDDDHGWIPIANTHGNWLRTFPNLEELMFDDYAAHEMDDLEWEDAEMGKDRAAMGHSYAAHTVKKLSLYGRIPSYLLETTTFPALDELTISLNEEGFCSTRAATVLPFGKSTKFLKVFNYADSPAFRKLRKFKELLVSFDHLSEVIVDRPLRDILQSKNISGSRSTSPDKDAWNYLYKASDLTRQLRAMECLDSEDEETDSSDE